MADLSGVGRGLATVGRLALTGLARRFSITGLEDGLESGGIFGNMIGFIEPLEVAFPTVTFGIFMVLMSLLGGKGTLWGPVIGAILFHLFKEVTWNYFLGWQWVALGALIVVTVVYFQDGVMGWLMHKRPEWFGIRVEGKIAEETK